MVKSNFQIVSSDIKRSDVSKLKDAALSAQERRFSGIR